jgi:hypothetical protein
MKHPRRVSFSFAIVFLLSISPVAKAQLSAYVTPMFTGWGLSDNSNTITINHGSGGIGGGVFYNFPIQSRLTAGVDMRGSDSLGNYGGDAFSASLRIAFVPRKVRLRPYFQIGGGVVSAPYTQYSAICSFTCAVTSTSKRATDGAALLAFGLDVRLTRSFDLRAIEYGAEAGPTGTSNSPKSGFGFLSTGVVYHLKTDTK